MPIPDWISYCPSAPGSYHDVIRGVCTRCGLGRCRVTYAELVRAKEEHIKHMDGVIQKAAMTGEAAYRSHVEDGVLRLVEDQLLDARARLGVAATEAPGSHDYIGPTKPDPDKPGRRLPVPDAVHEQVHRVVGDVLAGKVIPEARRQLQEALKSAPKEKPSLPTNATTMQIGLRLP